jgi:NAD(P)-dependent dehydrogenase (short-subunit alcohol dehydrogenase family)
MTQSPSSAPSRASIAVVIGSTGGIGQALFDALTQDTRYAQVIGLSRRSLPALDLTDEASIAVSAAYLGGLPGEIRLIILATGVLQGQGTLPEKTWRQLDPHALAQAFAINAIGPALVMKHMLPLLPRTGRAVFAALSAKVGGIGDNHLGGWYGYRASKAALNQMVRTAAIELARQRPEAICLALHPGTVDTGLSAPHGKAGLNVRSPQNAAALMLGLLDQVTLAQTGQFLDPTGATLPW